jgi:hypothetical protein
MAFACYGPEQMIRMAGVLLFGKKIDKNDVGRLNKREKTFKFENFCVILRHIMNLKRKNNEINRKKRK